MITTERSNLLQGMTLFWKEAVGAVSELPERSKIGEIHISLGYKGKASWAVGMIAIGEKGHSSVSFDFPRFGPDPIEIEFADENQKFELKLPQIIAIESRKGIILPPTFSEPELLGLMSDLGGQLSPHGHLPVKFGGLLETCQRCFKIYLCLADSGNGRCEICAQMEARRRTKKNSSDLALSDFSDWLLRKGFEPEVRVLDYRLDYFHPGARVAIEVDGDDHRAPSAVDADNRRDRRIFIELGIPVTRFSHREIISDLPKAKAEVERFLEK